MSTSVKQSGTELEVLEDQTPAGASQNDEFTHLHFDRRARAWRAHTNLGWEMTSGTDEHDTPELRSA
jgi:hypothetical protein